ncbi:hypothetical protein ACFFJX_19945 [Pseudarcicella hirudinis]|uniref:hypothetical protein n=1 Tax=Pseudarcicella hirudinis TaxID=1079859 RepID=UPI0035EABCCC
MGNGSYYFKSLSLNTARQPKQYDSIIVNYTLSDLSGKVLETTSTPFIYRYGFSSPIFFNQLISLMKEGEKKHLLYFREQHRHLITFRLMLRFVVIFSLSESEMKMI